MRDTVATSWRRLSDKMAQSDLSSSDGVRPQSSQQRCAAQLAAWESEGGSTTPSTEPRRVLIVDNDITSAHSLERMLHASGFLETRVAYSGHAGIAIAAEFVPNVILLELDLLDMNGYDLAQSLRERAQSQPLRLIALTYSREHAGRELARVAGIERYLLKPVSPLDLSELLEQPSR
jgi:CheY-like chemotaxis protein